MPLSGPANGGAAGTPAQMDWRVLLLPAPLLPQPLWGHIRLSAEESAVRRFHRRINTQSLVTIFLLLIVDSR